MITLGNKDNAMKWHLYINEKKCIGNKSLKDLGVNDKF